jgi:hypothetical protein
MYIGLPSLGMRSFSDLRFRIPSGLPTNLPMQLVGVESGVAVTDRNAVEAFQNSSLFTYNPSTIDVATSGALTTALRTSTAGSHIRLTANITTDPIDLRNTDASQAGGALGKLIDTNGFDLTYRSTGPDLTTQTYVVNGTHANVWDTTLTLAGSTALQRVFRTDVLDGEGEPTPFFKITTNVADLAAYAGDAFFVSGTALSIKLSTDGSVEAFKANLKGLYLGSAGTSRILLTGAPLCIWANGGDFVLDGVQLVTLDAGGRMPMFYAHGMRQTYSFSKGADLTQCGQYIVSNCLVYGSEADGANGFVTSAVAKGLMQTANCRFLRNGDTRTFAHNGTLQGVSAHGGVNHTSWGSDFGLNNGQGVADTCAASQTDFTWMVACDITGGQTTSANIGVGSAAASASRTMYLDSVTSTDAPGPTGDLAIAANGVVYVYNTTLGNVTGGSTNPYIPGTV